MVIKCLLCETEHTSFMLGQQGVTDALNIMAQHVQYKHKEEYKEYIEDITQLQRIIPLVPAFIAVDRFVDIEHEKTSKEFAEYAEGLEEGMKALNEIIIDENIEDDVEGVITVEDLVGKVEKKDDKVIS